MFHVKKHKQLHIFSPFTRIEAKRCKIPDKSWSGLFRKEILQELSAGSLRKYYHNSEGQPSKELYSMPGLMVLQQMHGLTDEEAVEQFAFNIKWHYALNITGNPDLI